jgi:hypothetical protein
MPYIDARYRSELHDHIEALADIIVRNDEANKHDGSYAGQLNFVITALILELIPERRYWAIAMITGVLENVKQEFYARYARPYEDEQIAKNGDVYL